MSHAVVSSFNQSEVCGGWVKIRLVVPEIRVSGKMSTFTNVALTFVAYQNIYMVSTKCYFLTAPFNLLLGELFPDNWEKISTVALGEK